MRSSNEQTNSIKAYILLNTVIGKTTHVAKLLSEMPEIKRYDIIMGPYDIIAEVEADSHDALSNLVLHKLQSIDAIKHTMTCPVLKKN